MGGTFDPIHLGHLVAAAQVREAFGLDQVVFVPTGRPWQKDPAAVSPADQRLTMTLLATLPNPAFDVSAVDIARGGATYAVDTLTDLTAAYGGRAALFFITGADALAGLTTWRDHERILELAHLVGVTRPGHELADPGLPPGSVSLLPVTAMAISSTECRARARAGLTLEYLVPESVAAFITKSGLYR
ncbi:MAG: nicotinate-nucleotide adenylyltransferase [Actinobacteria bacterium]|nr:MAG: nicotinate-nucleotide adenylyltransferase [Actinomycetota bacterium]